ncbi:hypothetical protein HYC85_029842 [Camellia sinensis]|uniref:Uncharacterized protein n=1 Tax=Camellia sinensis TaxID=4442 RepID=A0A7J7G0D0_CAMSI|nr:hypothetical protein HYC85_029842 [Camellia sinensis]
MRGCNNFAGSLSAYMADSLPDMCLNAIGSGPSLVSQGCWALISRSWVGPCVQAVSQTLWKAHQY